MRYEVVKKGTQVFVLDKSKMPYKPHRSGIVKVLSRVAEARELAKDLNQKWEEFEYLRIVLFRDSDFVNSDNSTDERWKRYNELLKFFNPTLDETK